MTQKHIRVKDNRRINFFQTDNDAVDVWARVLSHATFKVYIALCRYANNLTSEARVGYAHLAEALNMSTATVSAALKTLESEGLLTVERGYNERGAETNIYVLQPVTSMSEVGSLQ